MNIAKYLRDNPPGPFKPGCFVSSGGIQAYWKPDADYSEVVSEEITLLRSVATHEIIGVWLGLNFHLGNVVKYILRSEHKGNELEDLEKAAWYLNRQSENLKK